VVYCRYSSDGELVDILKHILVGKDVVYHTSPLGMRETCEIAGVRENRGYLLELVGHGIHQDAKDVSIS
jgi:hypothetical protein